jgi:putative addiction module component (TIGR02574 family)
MPININDIKKLSTEEKLKIIDAIWESIDRDLIEQGTETEEDMILRERIEKYEKGEMTFISWDEAKAKIEEILKK